MNEPARGNCWYKGNVCKVRQAASSCRSRPTGFRLTPSNSPRTPVCYAADHRQSGASNAAACGHGRGLDRATQAGPAAGGRRGQSRSRAAGRHAEHASADGDAVEIVTLVGGGSGECPADKPLVIGKFRFQSPAHSPAPASTRRYDLMRDCLDASGCEVTTVAVRRERLLDKQGRNLLDFLDLKHYTILPNTAGCFTAEDAIRHARLARELLTNLGNPGADWVKLECLGDKKTLLPDPVGTLQATEQLVKEGFQVLVYTSDDPILARRLKEPGAASVMPAGSPIGSGPGHPEPEQHPHLPGVSQGRRPGLSGDRRRRRRHGQRRDAWRWNWAATACC